MSVAAAAERLVRKGHEVVVFTTNSNLDEDLDVPTDQPVDVNGVEVWYFRREEYVKRWLPFVSYLSRSVGFMYTPKMRVELERVVPTVDLVHTQMPYVYPTYAAARAAIRFRKPLFYSQRGVFDPRLLQFRSVKKRLYIRLFERPVMRRATTLVALTQTEVENYRALGVQTPCRIIPNGIDVDAYRQEPSPEIQSLWEIPPESPVVLYMGRIHPTKGADRLLRAFLAISRDFPEAVLVMAGPDEWGLEAQFREEVRQAELDKRVIFPGMVSGNVKLDLLARADVFCLPSDSEGFSMAVLEAMASETAVLLSPGCHFPEVETAGAGRIADATPDAIAAALAELLGQPDRLREMGGRGRRFVSERYSWDHITDQLLDVYSEGIERNSRESQKTQVAGRP